MTSAISAILGLLSAAVTIYTILCFINIIISWFPGAKFTSIGKMISALTDPYMNFFSRSGWLRFGNIDFSPILSIGVLSVISSILGGITSTGRIYIGGILATIIAMLWNVGSSLLSIVFLLVLIRLEQHRPVPAENRLQGSRHLRKKHLLLPEGPPDYLDSLRCNPCRRQRAGRHSCKYLLSNAGVRRN